MSKVKMRCARCSKPFKSSDARQTLCPECTIKERLARAKGGASQLTPTARAVPPPKIIGPAAGGPGAAALAHTAPPPDTGVFGAAARRAEHDQRSAHPSYHAGAPTTARPASHAPSGAPARQGPERDSGTAGARTQTPTKGAQPKPPREPRPLKEPKEPKARAPQLPRELTQEEREQVERRYLELANPTEFDGIRTRIATELGLPKPLVRKAILELRQRNGLPSWWELQGFPGTASDLEQVRAAYIPLLPVPPIGIHKQLATQLGIEPHAVYRGIRQIRAQLGLPQFNPPEEHPEYVRTEAAAGAASTEPGTGVTAE